MHCVVMRAVATYVVALSVYAYVCVSVGYNSELCKHGWTDPDVLDMDSGGLRNYALDSDSQGGSTWRCDCSPPLLWQIVIISSNGCSAVCFSSCSSCLLPSLASSPVFVTTLPFPILALSFLTFHSSLFLYVWHRLQFNSYQFAGMTLLEEFFTVNVLNQFGACKMLLMLWTLITCMIYVGGTCLNLCIKDVTVG